MGSKAAFDRLVKFIAHSFYSSEYPPRASSEGGGKKKDDTSGMAVVILEALTRREWVKEDILADELCLNVQQVRRVLRHFEQEQLIMRVHRKETKRGGPEIVQRMEGQPSRAHTHSYTCLDYARFADITRLRIHLMRKKIEDDLGDNNKITEYKCPRLGCELQYNALDVFKLLDMATGTFKCSSCKKELVTVIGEGEGEDAITGNDEDRRLRKAELKRELDTIDEQLTRIVELLRQLEKVAPPDYGDLLDWEKDRRARGLDTTGATRAARGAGLGGSGAGLGGGGSGLRDLASGGGAAAAGRRDGPPQLQSLEGYGTGTTEVRVDLGEGGAAAGDESEGAPPKKVLPPWMVRESMKTDAAARAVAADQAAAPGGLSKSAGNAPGEELVVPAKVLTEEEQRKAAFLAAMKDAMRKKAEAPAPGADPGVLVEGGEGGQTERGASGSMASIGEKRGRDDEGAEWEDTEVLEKRPRGGEGGASAEDRGAKGGDAGDDVEFEDVLPEEGGEDGEDEWEDV